MTVIGITGPTGAGKTTALRALEELGGRVLDADAVYHRLLEENSALRNELQARFGPLTNQAGEIDRKKLGGIVFQNPEALADLNTITHRYVTEELRTRLDDWAKEGCSAAAIDASGLFESGLDRLCQATLAVLAPMDVRVARIMAREGISEEYARARAAAQPKDSFYRSRCGYVLVNDCPNAQVFGAKAKALLAEILKRAAE